MDFQVKGHSKYNLKLENNIVTKSSFNDDKRLVISATKQKKFKSNFFKKPKVYQIESDSFQMEYIKGESFSQFFNTATKRDLDFLIKKIDGYLKENIIGNVDIPISVFKNKLKSLPNGEDLLHIFGNKEFINVHVGLSHGDLTFSNMIFAEETYLIDFLDSYLESPTIDIVKLRQDTDLFWSLNMIDENVDLTKIKLCLNYIDSWIESNYKIEDYNILQIINLVRIYPYTSDNKIKTWLEKNINKLCETL